MATLLSRRQALVVGLGTVVLPLLSDAVAFPSQASDSSGGGRSIEILSSESVDFTAAVTEHFPGLLNEPEAVTLSPLFFLLTNTSDVAVSALAVKWEFTTATGRYQSFDRYAVAPVEPLVMTGQKPLIEPQGVRLISPFFSWSPAGFARQTTPRDWRYILSHSELTQYRVKELASASYAAITIDAVIYGDNRLVGLDHGRLGRLYTATRNAEHDQAVAVKRAIASGANQLETEQLLSSQIVADPAIPISPIGRRYTDSRRRQAALLLKASRTHTPDRFARIVSSIAKMPRTTVKRAIS